MVQKGVAMNIRGSKEEREERTERKRKDKKKLSGRKKIIEKIMR